MSILEESILRDPGHPPARVRLEQEFLYTPLAGVRQDRSLATPQPLGNHRGCQQNGDDAEVKFSAAGFSLQTQQGSGKLWWAQQMDMKKKEQSGRAAVKGRSRNVPSWASA